MRAGLRYGFPDWAEANVDPCTPAELTRYFLERGVLYTREFWRKLLRGDVRSAKLETWLRICDATGEPLSRFIDYHPDGRAPAPRERASKAKPRRPKREAPPRFPAPPDPHAHLGGATR